MTQEEKISRVKMVAHAGQIPLLIIVSPETSSKAYIITGVPGGKVNILGGH
jgi:hypothetical protein